MMLLMMLLMPVKTLIMSDHDVVIARMILMRTVMMINDDIDDDTDDVDDDSNEDSHDNS